MNYGNMGEVCGRVKKAFDDPQKGEAKRIVIVETTTPDSDWQNIVQVQGYKKGAELLSNIEAGDEVRLSVRLKSREYQGKYYDQINIAKVLEVIQPQRSAPQPVLAGEMEEPKTDDSDMPF